MARAVKARTIDGVLRGLWLEGDDDLADFLADETRKFGRLAAYKQAFVEALDDDPKWLDEICAARSMQQLAAVVADGPTCYGEWD